jgi:hypothetical protein
MYNAGEFGAAALRLPMNKTREWIVLATLATCAAGGAWGQDSSGQSLGDVARKTRKEHSSTTHVPAKHVATGEDDGPDASGVWRVRPCPTTTLCYELSIVLPKSPKWRRATSEPRPVLIPLAGHEEDPSRAIRVYAAETLAPMQSVEVAERTFLQAWFARPEYFGQGAQIVRDEHAWVDNYLATLTQFTITGDAFKYRGRSVIAGWAYGNYGFACVYRDEDSSAAASVCDAIVKSARYQVLQPAKPRVYADPGPSDGRPDDSPRDDDPE